MFGIGDPSHCGKVVLVDIGKVTNHETEEQASKQHSPRISALAFAFTVPVCLSSYLDFPQ